MTKKESHHCQRLVTICLGICWATWLIRPSANSAQQPEIISAAAPFPSAKAAKSTKGVPQKLAKGDIQLRHYTWPGPGQQINHVAFAIAKSSINTEMHDFGIPPATTSRVHLEKRGFRLVGPNIYAMDYPQIYRRNQKYFPDFAGALAQSLGLSAGADSLGDFLVFVQQIAFRQPPRIYAGLFINYFFPPIVCLYEQYGDCDSKSLLLASFLRPRLNPQEAMGFVLVSGRGVWHALLALKRNPRLGMIQFFQFGRGYYTLLECSSPGWSPGFISNRVQDALAAGDYLFFELD